MKRHSQRDDFGRFTGEKPSMNGPRRKGKETPKKPVEFDPAMMREDMRRHARRYCQRVIRRLHRHGSEAMTDADERWFKLLVGKCLPDLKQVDPNTGSADQRIQVVAADEVTADAIAGPAWLQAGEYQ